MCGRSSQAQRSFLVLPETGSGVRETPFEASQVLQAEEPVS